MLNIARCLTRNAALFPDRTAVQADGGRQESDLASYLLFDRDYVKRLIDLGYADAASHHAELVALFNE